MQLLGRPVSQRRSRRSLLPPCHLLPISSPLCLPFGPQLFKDFSYLQLLIPFAFPELEQIIFFLYSTSSYLVFSILFEHKQCCAFYLGCTYVCSIFSGRRALREDSFVDGENKNTASQVQQLGISSLLAVSSSGYHVFWHWMSYSSSN